MSSPSAAHNSPRGVKRSEASNVPPAAMADGTLTSEAIRGNTKRKEKKTKRPYNIRNKNRPKRPLSAYNLFFRYERERLVRETLTENGRAHDYVNLDGKMKSREKTRTGKRAHRKSHGAIGFAELGKRISEAWKSLDEKDRAPFQAEADKDKERYQRQLGDMKMVLPARRDRPRNLNRGEADSPQGNSANEKKTISNDLSEYHEGEYNEGFGMDEGSTAVLHHHPGYNYYQSPGHYPPATHYDYYGYHGNAPPHHNGPASPSGYAPPFGYQLPTLHREGEPNNSNPHHQTAHAFSPPRPTHLYDRHSDQHYPPPHAQGTHPIPGDSWAVESETETQPDFAFQCEVCNKAVFSTFVECADHEEECAKIHAASESPRLKVPSIHNPPRRVRLEDGDLGTHRYYKVAPNANSAKAEVEEQQAVEAVMMLKNPIEC